MEDVFEFSLAEGEAPMSDKITYIEEMPSDLLADPLNYIFACHFRQRLALALLRRLTTGTPDWETIVTELVEHLRHGMRLHIEDEEQDFFPLLHRKCQPEDEIDCLLEQLTAEHEAHAKLAGRVAAGLARQLRSGQPPWEDRTLKSLIITFVEREHRHLALENGAVLPLARVRLTAVDLQNLSQHMTARRTTGAAGSNSLRKVHKRKITEDMD